MAKLVKDFIDYQFTFYWVNDRNEQISPDLPTLTHAREWIVKFTNGQYRGADRRKRTYDRRYANGPIRDSRLSQRTAFSRGRRATDKPVEVEFDLSVIKIDELKEAI